MRGQHAISRQLANEVLISLTQGEHLRHDRQNLRSLVGFLRLLLVLFLPRRSIYRPDSAVYVLLANPVAHGARFAAAVLDALDSKPGAKLIGDRRYVDESIRGRTHNFPSLSVASMRGCVDIASIAWALRLRGKASLDNFYRPELSRMYLELLFLMQAIRYRLAWNYVQLETEPRLWLADFDRSAYCRPLIWGARLTGQPTATLVHGTPNKNYLPLVAEHVLVWGENQRTWFMRYTAGPQVHVIGRPEVDGVIRNSGTGGIRIVHSLEVLSESEQYALRSVCEEALSRGTHPSLRIHPSASMKDVHESWQPLVELCELEQNDNPLMESVAKEDVVLGVLSTAVVDAVTYGVQGWSVADIGRDLPCDIAVLRRGGSDLLRQIFPSSEREVESSEAPTSLTSVRAGVVEATGSDAKLLISGTVIEILNTSVRTHALDSCNRKESP